MYPFLRFEYLKAMDIWELWIFGSSGYLEALDIWKLWTFGSSGYLEALDIRKRGTTIIFQ